MIFPETYEPRIVAPEKRLWLPDWREPRELRHRAPPRMSASCCDCGGIGCSYNAGCCTGLPDTLHVTFSNSTKCAVIDGLTFTLTRACCGTTNCRYGGADHSADAVSSWDYSGACTGGVLNISFACCNAKFGPGFPNFAIDMGGNPGGAGGLLMSGNYTSDGPGSSVTCSPFQVVIGIGSVRTGGVAGGCTGCTITPITATIVP